MQTPIYVKTVYSFLSSTITIDNLIKYAKDNNLTSLCICDDNMYGVMEFIKKCNDNNIKPIVGMDFNKYLLFCKNYDGYLNLLKLNTIYSEREIKNEDLIKYQSNLICLSLNKDDELKNIFDNYYDDLYLKKTLCLKKEDIITLKYLNMLRDNKTLSDEYEFNDDVLFNYQENKNNDKFYNECNLVLPKNEINLPLYNKFNNIDVSNEDYLLNLSIKGLNKRLNNNVSKEYKERLLYEFDIIKKMGFCNYFLIVYDFICYAKKNGILVGPGRGSACSSLLAYSLGITDVDPIKYHLLFERFLNTERVKMPDIDTDFPDNKREEVINYCINKYGNKNVCNIITFSYFAIRMALRDIGRVMNIPTYTIDALCKLINKDDLLIEDVYKNNIEFKRMIDSDKKLRELFLVSKNIIGLPRHSSIHAAGVIIANTSIDDVIPIYYNDGKYITGYEAKYLEELGLIKMDFLGIKNLTIIDETIKLINEHNNSNLRFSDIPLDDKKTYNLFMEADTEGIFQFENNGMKNFIKRLEIKNFKDIYNAIAFYRPGPSNYIDLFIKRHHGLEKCDYYHDDFKDILSETEGILVYQEQVMLLVHKMASFSLGDADVLIKAMSKKNKELLSSMQSRFIEGSLKNGYSRELIDRIYDDIMRFANYGFNKSHSIAYSIISYKMAYLKANFPEYFYVSYLNNDSLDKEKENIFIREMKKRDIKIIKPDINKSTCFYQVNYHNVILPLTIIKGISRNIVDKIIEKREFNSIYDVFNKLVNVGFNKNQFIALIDSGSLDSFNINRKTLYENLDSLINYGNLCHKLGDEFSIKPEIINYPEFDKEELINKEKELFGYYLTSHPVSLYKTKYNNIVDLCNIKKYFNKDIIVIGMIDKIREIKDKKGDLMAFLSICDEETNTSITLFSSVYNTCHNLRKNDIILVEGRVERRSEYSIIASKIKKVNE